MPDAFRRTVSALTRGVGAVPNVAGERGRCAPGGKPDIADVIYGIHRCTHGHGDELPDGFDLLEDVAGPKGITRIVVERGAVQLSDRIVFALIAVAVLSPVNATESVPEGYHLTYGHSAMLPILRGCLRSRPNGVLRVAVFLYTCRVGLCHQTETRSDHYDADAKEEQQCHSR